MQVTCIIIGIRNKQKGVKALYEDNLKIETNNINGYLIDSNNIFIEKRNEPLIKDTPIIRFGSMPNDNGGLMLTKEEVDKLTTKYSNSNKFIKNLIGSDEFINGYNRYVDLYLGSFGYDKYILWLEGKELSDIDMGCTFIDSIKKHKMFRDIYKIQTKAITNTIEETQKFLNAKFEPLYKYTLDGHMIWETLISKIK